MSESTTRHLFSIRNLLMSLPPLVRQAVILLHQEREKALKGAGQYHNNDPICLAYGLKSVDFWKEFDPSTKGLLRQKGWSPIIFNAFVEWYNITELPERERRASILRILLLKIELPDAA